MKTVTDLGYDLERRLSRDWAQVVAGEVISGSEEVWNGRFPLGATGANLAQMPFSDVVDTVADLRIWAKQNSVALTDQNRKINGVIYPIPTHVEVGTIDDAAKASGTGIWVERLRRGRERAARLQRAFTHEYPLDQVLRGCDSYTVADFELLIAAATWFRDNDASGLTPRQVPLPGFHAKWLDGRQKLVAMLSGKEDLGLTRSHPSRIHFTYHDPEYLRLGGRKHDSAATGDTMEPAYLPDIVLISENKDTAIYFPELPGLICVEGAGAGATSHASFGWLTSAPTVIYWGDMDADGLEILNSYREAGVPAKPMFMNRTSYQEWERFGTHTDKNGKPLEPRAPKSLRHLTEVERELYLELTAPEWRHYRRIEQERIPLERAVEEVVALSVLRSHEYGG